MTRIITKHDRRTARKHNQGYRSTTLPKRLSSCASGPLFWLETTFQAALLLIILIVALASVNPTNPAVQWFGEALNTTLAYLTQN